MHPLLWLCIYCLSLGITELKKDAPTHAGDNQTPSVAYGHSIITQMCVSGIDVMTSVDMTVMMECMSIIKEQ